MFELNDVAFYQLEVINKLANKLELPYDLVIKIKKKVLEDAGSILTELY